MWLTKEISQGYFVTYVILIASLLCCSGIGIELKLMSNEANLAEMCFNTCQQLKKGLNLTMPVAWNWAYHKEYVHTYLNSVVEMAIAVSLVLDRFKNYQETITNTVTRNSICT